MSVIRAYARYEDAAGDGVNGLVVTWDIERVTRLDGTRIALGTGEATNIVFGRRGLYGIRIAGADTILYDYIFTAVTASATPTGHEIAAVVVWWSADWYDAPTADMVIAGSVGALFVDVLDAPITDIPADVLAEILEGAHTVGDAFRIMLAALAGRSTGGGTFTNRFRDVANAKNRIDATVDANGNRTAITIDGTP